MERERVISGTLLDDVRRITPVPPGLVDNHSLRGLGIYWLLVGFNIELPSPVQLLQIRYSIHVVVFLLGRFLTFNSTMQEADRPEGVCYLYLL